MSIITSKYRSDTARRFVDDVAFSDYYLFVSSTANTTVSNTEKSKKQFLEKTLFGKKITSEEVFFMIKNYPWEIDTAYDQYDDDADMTNKKFYTVVYPVNNEVGDYRIYKCLFNNYGAKSTTPPNYSALQQDQIYRLADGYVWKYMYSISELEFDAYNTRGYIPIIEDVAVGNNEISTSSVNQIFVVNPTQNRGYEEARGLVFEVNPQGDIVITPGSGTLNAIRNYYSGYSFYVTSVFGVSNTYTIDTYAYDQIFNRAVVTLVEGVPDDGILSTSASYKLLPRIVITGDGTGATAVANVSSDGTITGVAVLNPGSGYTNVTALVPDPFSFDPSTLSSLDERVILRAVLSPIGGHSADLIDELKCKNILMYTTFTETDNITLPTSNDFTSIGIVKNPLFKNVANNDIFDNRIELALDDHSLAVNEIVTQIETDPSSAFYNQVTFSGKVHAVSNNFVYICEYIGPYPNSTSNTDFSDISLNINLPIRSADNQILNINTDNNPEYPLEYDINYPGFSISPYVQKTGEVYYMNSFFPITRTEESREQFKILLEF